MRSTEVQQGRGQGWERSCTSGACERRATLSHRKPDGSRGWTGQTADYLPASRTPTPITGSRTPERVGRTGLAFATAALDDWCH